MTKPQWYLTPEGKIAHQDKSGQDYRPLPHLVGYRTNGEIVLDENDPTAATWVNFYTDKWIGSVESFWFEMRRVYAALPSTKSAPLTLYHNPGDEIDSIARLAFWIDGDPNEYDYTLIDAACEAFAAALSAIEGAPVETHFSGDDFQEPDGRAHHCQIYCPSGQTVYLMIRFPEKYSTFYSGDEE